jgi:hypothetical protein
MSSFSKISDFMGGIYIIELESPEAVGEFIERYRSCPVWPVVTKGVKGNQVFILAIELKQQQHGDFTQQNNTLVKNPHYLGAKEIIFKRDDSLLALFKEHKIQTGISNEIPCGSNCVKCPQYLNPCQGCPAYYKYGFQKSIVI